LFPQKVAEPTPWIRTYFRILFLALFPQKVAEPNPWIRTDFRILFLALFPQKVAESFDSYLFQNSVLSFVSSKICGTKSLDSFL
jgi:hypothetical protein